MKPSTYCLVAILAILLTGHIQAAEVLVGTQPFTNAGPRFSLDIFPVAFGYAKSDDMVYWHGLATGVAVAGQTRLISISYGTAFCGLHSGGVFAGPIFDLQRNVGIDVDVVYALAAAPIKISLQRISSVQSGDMLFSIAVSAGVGVLLPLLRLENGLLRTILDR